MEYLRKFTSEADYQEFEGSDKYVTPNVSYVESTDECHFNPKVELIENKLRLENYVANYVHGTRFRWDYPIESDVTVVYRIQAAPNLYSDPQTTVIPKGTQRWSPCGNTIVSITPSKDSKYIYTTDLPIYQS